MSNIRTNSPKFKKTMKEYFVSLFLNEEANDIKTQLEKHANEYKIYKYGLMNIEQKLYTGFLQGLPSNFDVPYTYQDIKETMKHLYEKNNSTYKKKDNEAVTNEFYYLMYKTFIELCEEYNIDYYN